MSSYRLASLFVVASVAAGCASHSPAPVRDRSSGTPPAPRAETPAVPVPAPVPVARPGYYIVKPGDTLIRIALEHGQSYRDIAAWSGLENPNLIEVGQELRVRPPESGVVVRPVTANGGLEARPAVGAVMTPPPATDGVRREPRGGKLPYSEAAWAQAQKPDAPVLAKIDPKPETRPEPKPETRTETKTDAKSAEAVKAEAARAEAAKQEAARQQEAAKTATGGGGDETLQWSWPAGGKVLAGFNETSSKGIDVAGKPGDPVLAAAGGKVVYAGTGLRGYGKLVIIKHDNSYLSAYAHNQQLLVKEGQSVARGQKIAELGDTDSDRPKLHFEIRRQGKPVDPGKYLPPR